MDESSGSRKSLWPYLGFLLPVSIAVVFYQVDSFDPAPLPMHELTHQKPMSVPRRNSRLLHGSEKIGLGQLLGPEDIVFDPESKVIYTGCDDGWVKRVTVKDSAAESVVENWVNTGGRPLGVALGHSGQVIVADADKGLLKVSGDGVIVPLTDEAEGLKFKVTNGVIVSKNGMIYFTDASYKYNMHETFWEGLEGRPHGRLLSYDPLAKQTTVLARDLYYANGITLSPDESFIIFCESLMRRCKKYHIQGPKKGSIEAYVDNLRGLPDNIQYDGEGRYWIAIAAENSYIWEKAEKYVFIRKVMALMEKYGIGRLPMEKHSGVLVVDLEGKPAEYYYDHGLFMATTGIKIGDHLYISSISNSYIIRLNLTQYPAVASG